MITRYFLRTSRNLLFFVVVIQWLSQVSSAQQISKYSGDELSALLTKNAGVTIEINPVKSHYSMGEDIQLTSRVYMSPPRQIPWAQFEFSKHIRLSCDNNEPVLCLSSGFPFVEHTSDAVDYYEMTFTLSSCTQQKAIKDYGMQTLLLPGKYTGIFDEGIMSNVFTFTIDPTPDSLLSDWSVYCELEKFTLRHSRFFTDAMVDSLRDFSQTFLQKPTNSRLRKEALGVSLYLFRVAFESHNGYWQPNDSLFCENLLLGLANEPEMSAHALVGKASNTLYIRLDKPMRCQAVLSLAQRSGRQDFIRAAEERVAETNH